MNTNEAYALGVKHGRGGCVDAGLQALSIYALAPDEICSAYSSGVADGQSERAAEAEKKPTR